MVALEQQAYEIAGQPFNLGSPKQIGEILFGRLGLPVKKKTASGAPSTDEEVLQDWPPTSRCRRASSSTAAWPSSRAPTPTSCR
jgi:DNA polymerase I-like protein with 3'-5' exonuclease and polymerase domains